MTPFAVTTWRSWRAWAARHVLLLALTLLVPGFAATSWAVSRFRSFEHSLAAAWYRQGESDLRAGRLAQAVDDYRAALAHSHDAPAYRLRLAQVLVRVGQRDAARADLFRLWEDEPGNSVINLELARLAARRHEVADAVRYYNNAIYGTWPVDAASRRQETQLELVDYLIATGRAGEAQAALMALAADVPPDPNVRITLGDRLLKTGAARAALQQYRNALAIAPASPPALSGAGRAAFLLGLFPDAARYLQRAVNAGDKDPITLRNLETSQAVLDLDPFAGGLASGERVRRVRTAFDRAVHTFAPCVAAIQVADSQPFDAAAALHARLAAFAPTLRTAEARDAQVQQDAMDIVFDTEEFAAAHCGPLRGDDEALMLLARTRRGQP